MEAVEDIFRNTTEEDLAVLIDYCDAILAGSKYKAKLAAMTKEERNSTLVSTLQQFAKSFFLSNLEYDEIVAKVAKRMDINIYGTEPTDYLEAMIAGRFVIDNFNYIPKAHMQEMREVLKCGAIKNSKLRLTVDEHIIANIKSAADMYKILAWMTKSIRQSYLETKGAAWQSTSLVSRIFRRLLGGSTFRMALIIPLIYISMLRYKYRCQKHK